MSSHIWWRETHQAAIQEKQVLRTGWLRPGCETTKNSSFFFLKRLCPWIWKLSYEFIFWTRPLFFYYFLSVWFEFPRTQFFSHPFLTLRCYRKDFVKVINVDMAHFGNNTKCVVRKRTFVHTATDSANRFGLFGGCVECERKSVNALIWVCRGCWLLSQIRLVTALTRFVGRISGTCNSRGDWISQYWWQIRQRVFGQAGIYLMRNFIITFHLNREGLDQIRRTCHFHSVYV